MKPTVTDSATLHVIPDLRVDHSDDGADRRFLAAGETNGDGKSTTTSPTHLRVDWWHKQDQTRPGPSMTPTMAATTARLRYAGDMRLVELKQMA